MDGIRDELEELEVQNYEQKAFVTQDALKGLFDENRINAIVTDLSHTGKIQVYQREEVVKAILGNGLRLFATLISLSRPELILKFIEADHFAAEQFDSKLPFSKQAVELILKDDKLSTRFEKHQWRFFLPFFCADQSHRELGVSTRLPFVRCEHIDEGGFGEVYKMFLPASCQGLVPEAEGEVCIVRKQIKRKGNAISDYQREQHILSMLRCLNHPSIIKLLTAYTINQTHNFLFPLADGDLKWLFRQESRPLGMETDNNIWQALHELASAIEAVHDYFSEKFNIRRIGCHYDLKPGNILYRSGKLMLSDFGLSRLSEEIDGSDSVYQNGAADYWAPECLSLGEGFKRLPVGRSSDIWSFGCILLELLTYLQEGPSGVKRFSEKRTIDLAPYWTTKTFHGGDKPNEGVVQWLSLLRQKSTTAQNELIAVIQNLLRIEPSERPKAKDVTFDLFHIAQHELYNLIDRDFHRVLEESGLELQVEYERFRLWGEKTGIKDRTEYSHRLRDMSGSQKFADLQIVRDALSKLREEIECLLMAKGPRYFRPHYHIQKIIDKLWDMQLAQVRSSMMNELENRLLSTDDGVQLEAIEAVFNPAERSLEHPTVTGDSIGPVGQRRLGLLATMKQIASVFDDRTQPTDDLLLQEQEIKTIVNFKWHSTAIYQPPDAAASQVLVEYLEYNGPLTPRRAERLIDCLRQIASFRTVSVTSLIFPVLTCAGYYYNLESGVFAVVYQFPPRPAKLLSSIPDVETPISLRDILKKVRERSQRPSLDEIFAIALRLISLVLSMHKANWLHKSISSHNIIFFADRFASIADSMTSPYFIGFNYSRPEERFTIMPPPEQLDYGHPIYTRGQKPFCQEFDYYSIGLVLLELGFWDPLTGITRDIRGGTPEELLEGLLKDSVPSLKSYMGDAYAEAVGACLRMEFGESSKTVEVRESFERKVLQRIRNRNT